MPRVIALTCDYQNAAGVNESGLSSHHTQIDRRRHFSV